MSASDAERGTQASLHDQPTVLGTAPAVDSSAEFSDPKRLLGRQIGGVELQEIVGQGGFGTVFRGYHARLKRNVAVKFLNVAFSEEAVRKFQLEAEHLAALDKDPGIVTIYDEGVLDGQPYFVLEYVASSAKELLEESGGKLELRRACEIAAQIADALRFAHSEGYVHRDVKPGNILIEAHNGRAKLADFGLARLERLEAVDSTGSVLRGTPPYMAPEYLRGEEKPNSRTDIYALGVSLYELLSGELPYEGKSTNEILDKIRMNKRVPLQERAPELPSAVLDIVDKATAYDAKQRYRSAADMKADLDAVLASLSAGDQYSSADLTTRRLSRKQKLGLITVGSLASVAIAAVVLLAVVSGPTFGERIEIADGLLDEGRAADSERIYRELLEARPGSAAVEYGLGYALLQQGKTEEASETFAAVDETPLQREGSFAVALASSPERARPFAETAQGDAVTSYFKTLAARLDLLEANHANVLERLAELEAAGFRFKWQYAEALELLGRALKASGRPGEAQHAFESMAAVAGGAGSTRAEEYLASLALEEANAARVERLRTQLQDVRARMDATGYTPPTPAERWRSRPVRFTVSQAENNGSLIAVEYGLEDRLPVWLEQELTENTPYVALSRTNLDEVLLEQDIALELASAEGAIQLQQLLAGRVTIEPRLSRFGDDEMLEFRLVDNETSESVWSEGIVLIRPLQQGPLLTQIQETMTAALRAAYPLRANLRIGDNGGEIDIGTAVGVREGDRFVLLGAREMRSELVVPDVRVVVRSPLAEYSAGVEITGANINATQIPEDGLPVVEENWYDRATKAD